MIIPENHERLQVISEVFGEKLAEHTEAGGTYYDEHSERIAAEAIHTIMPGLVHLQRTRIVVEATTGMAVETSQDPKKHEGLHVEAQLERVAIQALVSILGEGDHALTMTSYDLCAIFRPQYRDPEPGDIVFGEELLVPFKDILLFEPVA